MEQSCPDCGNARNRINYGVLPEDSRSLWISWKFPGTMSWIATSLHVRYLHQYGMNITGRKCDMYGVKSSAILDCDQIAVTVNRNV